MSDRNRWLMDNLTTGIVVVKRDLRLAYMNSAAQDLFALSFRQAKSLGFIELVNGSVNLTAALERCLSSGHSYTERELPINLPGPRTITVDCILSPLGGKDLPDEILLELQQVDRQLRISKEEQLLAQQSISRVLIRNLAHEIKNPLGGVRGAAQLLERELDSEVLKEYTQVIIGEADRLRNLVDRMLGPISPPSYCATNIHQVLERVRQLILAEASSDIVIRQDYDPSIPNFICDPEQLIQAVLNIARNAVQALDGKGSIVFCTRIQRQCTIGQERHKLVARVDIIDDGPGIPSNLVGDIFYPMISGRGGGTGLGLSIAQGLVNQHRGLIECISRPGETVFTLLLPLDNSVPAQRPGSRSEHETLEKANV